LGYNVVCWNSRVVNVTGGNKGYGTTTCVITAAGAIGNDGVGNVEGAKVIDAAAAVGCIIPRKCGIGNSSSSSSGAENAAAAVGSSIACDSGIGDGKGALVKDTATAIVSSIACDGGVGDSDVTTIISIVDTSAVVGSRIAGEC
jgi:hypothetical protein